LFLLSASDSVEHDLLPILTTQHLEDGHECVDEGVKVVVARGAVRVRVALLVQVYIVVIVEHHLACETLHAQQGEDVDDQYE